MTKVPIESGRAQAFHRHREVRDHGDPVLHPRRQFPDHGGVARRMIDFASAWSGTGTAAGPRRGHGLRAVRRGVGSSPATVVAIGSIILPAMVKQGFPRASAPA
jgi:C4-dicarboxylate transporter DctM subunit